MAAAAVLAAVLPILLTKGGPNTPTSPDSTQARGFTVRLPSDAEAGPVAFSPDGRFLAVGASQTGATYLYNAADGQLAAILKVRGSSSINGIAFSPDGKFLASANVDGQIFLWDVSTGTLAATLKYGGYGHVAFSPDGKLLAASSGFDLDVWNVATRRRILTEHVASLLERGGVQSGRQACGRRRCPGVPLGRRDRPAICRLLRPDRPGDMDVAFSPDGKALAVGDNNGGVYLWDVAGGNVTATLVTPGQRPNGGVNTVAFSPDGRLLASTDDNQHVYLWNLTTHKIVGTIVASGQFNFWGVAFSPDGKLVAAADGNGIVYVRVVSQLIS